MEEAGRKSLAIETDVSQPDACDRLVQAAMEAFGRVDVLVNNAGAATGDSCDRENGPRSSPGH